MTASRRRGARGIPPASTILDAGRSTPIDGNRIVLLHRSIRPAHALLAALLLAPATASAIDKGPVTTQAIAPAAATTSGQLDTPGLSSVLQMPSGFVLQITAGASGAPGGFSVQYMKLTDFNVYGWPDDYFVPVSTYAGFDGVPTLHVTSADFQLEPGTTTKVFVGELFDETGVGSNNTNELDAATQYVVRVRAEADGTVLPSAPSGNLSSTTLGLNNCTYTIGWWKNHPSQWPLTTVTLGTVNYTAADIFTILNTSAKGNGLISLAHQLIAAKFNMAQGASVIGIAAAISQADALIGGLVVPPIGSGFLAPTTTASLTNTFDQFNNGLLGVDHCSGVVLQSKSITLGGIRALYR